MEPFNESECMRVISGQAERQQQSGCQNLILDRDVRPAQPSRERSSLMQILRENKIEGSRMFDILSLNLLGRVRDKDGLHDRESITVETDDVLENTSEHCCNFLFRNDRDHILISNHVAQPNPLRHVPCTCSPYHGIFECLLERSMDLVANIFNRRVVTNDQRLTERGFYPFSTEASV